MARPSNAMGTAGLAAHTMSRTFRGGHGVHDVSLHVNPGEIHALVGLNGAGKSTVMRLLLGMLRPDSGTVRLCGADLRKAPPALWCRLGHLIEVPLAYGELSGRANLEIAARLHGLSRGAMLAAVESIISELDLDDQAATLVRRMSLGNRQRVGLGAALQHDPVVIVLDEPTNALDPAGVITLREALLRRAAAGAAILVSSHHLDEVARVADRITVMNRGRVIGHLDPDGVDLERTFFGLVHTDDEDRREERP